ncbi:peptide-binding protein [Algoriphagus chordae]|uniref:Right handed beta helix region n=1 Tax=Algoriphagus chordae TaxID=237019 RepID=A0A2W7RC48_9BACT|nr:peptide-binding protein [Algoriphagus chordae]PZX48295.1 Right handed beta helix region [Algoriphagus chordae]
MSSNSIKIPFTLVLLILLQSIAFAQREFYVSQLGNDDNRGTEESPFRSIGHAKEVIKAFKAEKPAEKVTLILRDGTYYLSEPLVFDSKESGSTDAPYTIRAAEGEKVILSGGMSLDLKWKHYKGDLLVAKVPKGIDFSSLYINSEKQIRARYPNYQADVYPFNGFSVDAISKEKIATWKNPKGGYIHALHKSKWGGMHYVITGKFGADSLMYEGGWQNNRSSGLHPEYRFVENISEELDSPNEWFLDREKGLLYFYPEEGLAIESIQKVEVGMLENLISFKGDKDLPVHDIVLQNLTFQQSRPTFMKTEERLMRSDWTVYRSGAILLDGTENILIEDNVFQDLGGNAIFVSNYNRNTSIKGNLIEEIGGSAISFVGNPDAVRSPSFNYHEFVPEAEIDTVPGPKSENYPANSLVADNLIRNIGTIEKQVAGVQIEMAMDLHIVHNTIYNVPRAGINIGDGAWGGHIIEYNDVFNTVMETGDHGAFNSWGRDRFWHPNRQTMDELTARHPDWIKLDAIKTTIIRNNRFHCDHGWDIDLDDGSSNYEIYNNLALSGGIKLREGFYRTVYNNIMVNNGFHPHVWFKESHDVFTRNIVMTSHKQIRVNYWGDKVDENFFTTEEDLDQSRSFGIEASGEFGDPMFVDPETGDFSLHEDSPAIQSLGFVNFDMDNFGVTSPALKKMAATPEIPFLLLENEENKSEIREWHGFKVKNMETLGEQSAAGLNEITGVIVLELPDQYDTSAANSLRVGDVILSCWDEEVSDFISLSKVEKGNNWKGRTELKVWRNQAMTSAMIQ